MATRNEISEKMKPVISDLVGWCNGQFADWFTPNPRHVKSFVVGFLLDMVNNYEMPMGVSYSDMINDWNIDEPFGDAFYD